MLCYSQFAGLVGLVDSPAHLSPVDSAIGSVEVEDTDLLAQLLVGSINGLGELFGSVVSGSEGVNPTNL
jgi:hypothetical protein